MNKKTKFESSTCTIEILSDNENINLKMPSFLWQGNLPNRASKIKRLLAGQVFSYTSVIAKSSFASHCSYYFTFRDSPLHCAGKRSLYVLYSFIVYNLQTLILHELLSRHLIVYDFFIILYRGFVLVYACTCVSCYAKDYTMCIECSNLT
jgi:hypothetical protein